MIQPNNYYVASRLTHNSYSGGDVYMYIKSKLDCSMIDLSQYCIKKVTDVCAVQIKIVITLLYYYAYTDLLVEILVNLLYYLT